MPTWNKTSDGMPIGRQFVWAMGSHGESFPIVIWTDGKQFYPPFVDTPEKGAEPYEDDTFARWLPLAALTAQPTAHEALVANCHNIVALAGGWDDQGATGPRSPLSWETVARMAIDYARAALINAYDLPSDTTPQQLRQVQAGVLVWRGDYWEMPPATPDKVKG